jgi:hypothetical protein
MRKSNSFTNTKSVLQAAYVGLLLLLFGITQSQAATKTWVGATTGGSWSLASNWSPASVPSSSDNIVINVNSSTFQFTGLSTVTIASLDINGTTGTFNWGTTSATVTVSGAIVCQIDLTLNAVSMVVNNTWTVLAGKSIIMNTSSNINLNGISSLLTFNGNLNFTAGSITCTSNSKLVVNSGATLSFNTGINSSNIPNMTVNSGGIVVVAPGTGTPVLNTMSIDGKLLIGGSGNINGSSGGSPVYTANGTLEYATTAAKTAGTREWPTTNSPANVIINTSFGVTLTTSRSITGTLTLTTGAFTLSGATTVLTFNGSGSAAPVIKTGGTITCTNSPSLSFSPTGSANWILPDGTFTTTPTLTNLISDMNPSATSGSLTLNNQDITVSGTSTGFNLSSGLLIVGTGNLDVAYTYGSGFSATKMVITSSSSGFYRHSFSTSSYQTFTYPIGENIGTAEYCGFSFSLESNSVTRIIGFKVIDAVHPNMGSAANYLSRYWPSSLSVATGTYTYTVTLPYNGTIGDIVGSETKIGVQDWNSTAWQGMSATVNTSSNYLSFSSATQANAPLGFDITGRQSDNDDACGAVNLTAGSPGVACSSPTSGSTAGSTQTYSGCSGTADDDVWYKFTATATSHFVNVTGSASFDAVVQAYTLTSGTCPTTATFTAVASSCTDATYGGGTTEVMMLTGLSIGTTYYVRVYHTGTGSSATPTFTICVTTPPLNDEPCGATTLTPATSCNPTACDAAMASQTNTYATCDFSYTSPARDLWYKFVATATSHTIQATGNGTFDPVLQVYSGACSSLTAISGACADNTSAGAIESVLLSGLTPGNTYYFRIYHGSSTVPTNTTFSVCVLSPPVNDEPCNGTSITAVTLTPGTTCVGTTGDASLASQTYAYGSCDYSYTSPLADVWYRFQATSTSHTVQVTGNGTYDAILTGYSANVSTCPVTLTAISGACLDATGAGATETMQLSGLVVGNWYYVRVYHGSSTVPSNTTFTICILSPPVNDEPCSAIILTPGATCNPITGNANLASQTYTYASCDYSYTSTARDVWFKFTATGTTHFVRVAGNGDYDAVVQIYTGACGSLTAMTGGCADNTSGGGIETLTLTGLVNGTTYYVRVYHGSSSMPINTTFGICVYSPPVNDDPCGAITLIPQVQTCSSTSGDVANATQTFTGCIGTANDDVWFKFVAAATTQFVVVDGSTSFDAVVQAYYAGSCGAIISTSNIGSCADATTADGVETLSMTGLTVGLTYYVRVYDYYSGFPATTTFTICVITPPTNDEPCGAVNLTPALSCTPTTGDVAYASQTYTGCQGTANDDVWYKFTAASTSQVITVAGSASFEAVVQAYSGASCSTLTAIAGSCTENIYTGGTETMTLTGLTVGVLYYVRVYDYYSGYPTTTTFTICVVTPPPPPANDDCPGTALTLCAAAISGTTVSATQTLANYSGMYGYYDDDDVWYNFVASGSNALITLTNTTMDGVLNLRSATACPGGNIQYRDFTGNAGTETMRVTGLTNGSTYKIRVFSYDNLSSSDGAFNIAVCNTSYTPALNDNVVNASVVSTGTTNGNNNSTFGFEVGEPAGNNWGFNLDNTPTVVSNTQWFTFTPATTGGYNIVATQGSGIQVAVYTATSAAAILTGGATQVASGSSSGSNVSLNAICLTAGTTYYIQLNGYLGSTGTPSLNIAMNIPTAPVATAATNVGCSDFQANWTAVANAGGYHLDVSNDNFVTFTGIYNDLNVGNVTTYYVSGLTSGSTYKYRVRAHGNCTILPVSANSNEIMVTLDSASGGGIISGGDTICAGSISGLLTLTGNTGNVIKWQSSISPFTNWSDIANTSNTYTSGPLTETTWFRAVVQNGVCGTANSAYTIVSVGSSTQTPGGSTTQSFCINATVADLLATGTGIQWYDSATTGNLLAPGTALINGNHYYASQTLGTCESVIRLDVTVSLFTSIQSSVSLGIDQNPVCTGTAVTFTATATNGGNPTYQWHLNGAAAGYNSATYSYTPANGDQVFVTMTSSFSCATGSPSTSSLITMVVSNAGPAGVNLVVDQNTVCEGITVTFTATPTNGGSPSYQWYKNSFMVGANLPTYSYVPLNLDQVSVVMTSSLSCVTGNPASSGSIAIFVNTCTGIEALSEDLGSLIVYPNPTNDKLFVNFDQIKETPLTIKMLSAHGQLVFESNKPLDANLSGIDVSQMNAGTYLVQILFKNSVANKYTIVE